jgi:hypothetical protein
MQQVHKMVEINNLVKTNHLGPGGAGFALRRVMGAAQLCRV